MAIDEPTVIFRGVAGIDKPSEIAEMLDKPQPEIDVVLRRFKRVGRAAIKEHTK